MPMMGSMVARKAARKFASVKSAPPTPSSRPPKKSERGLAYACRDSSSDAAIMTQNRLFRLLTSVTTCVNMSAKMIAFVSFTVG